MCRDKPFAKQNSPEPAASGCFLHLKGSAWSWLVSFIHNNIKRNKPLFGSSPESHFLTTRQGKRENLAKDTNKGKKEKQKTHRGVKTVARQHTTSLGFQYGTQV